MSPSPMGASGGSRSSDPGSEGIMSPSGSVSSVAVSASSSPSRLDRKLIASVSKVHDMSIAVDRATGVIDVSGARFRPSYTTTALTPGEKTYLATTGDAQGVAYFLGDLNADGTQDVTVFTDMGKQVLYGVPAL